MTSSTNTNDLNFLLALDDRVEFCADVLSKGDSPSAATREEAANLKRVVFDGVTKAIENGVQKSELGLWADTDLGESVLLRARAMSLTTASSPGKGSHSLGKLRVDYTAVQLTLNPDGPEEARKELLARLKTVSDRAREEHVPLLIELNSLPTATQVEMYGGRAEAQGMLVLMAMQQLQDAGIAPAVWAFEPTQDDDVFTEAIAAQAALDDQKSKVLLVIDGSLSSGRIGTGIDSSDQRVIELAAKTPGIAGVLVGPGAYYRHIVRYSEDLIERDEAVDTIAEYLTDISDIFARSRAASEVH